MANKKEEQEQECFVIMPISDPKGYDVGHFKRVYEDIIIPACKKAGYKAIRGDEIEETDMIHLSILKKLVETPMVICDLSSRNPNVLFELGLRQAFDKPVVLIQEKGTERIFDISVFRAYDYCKELKYNEVLEDQEKISRMLKGTEDSYITGEGFNSIIKLLGLSQGAQIKSIDDPNQQLQLQLFQLSSQMDDISSELRNFRNNERNSTDFYNLKNSQNLETYKRENTFEMDLNEFYIYETSNNYLEALNVYQRMIKHPLQSNKAKEEIAKVRLKLKDLEEEYLKNKRAYDELK